MSQSANAVAHRYVLSLPRQSASPIEYPLENGRSVFLGRGDSCGIQLKGDDVQEIHCLLDVDRHVPSIQDWASDIGTKVNGHAIEDKTILKVGDRIELGSVTLFLESKGTVTSDLDSGNAARGHRGKRSGRPEESSEQEESIGMEHLGVDGDSGSQIRSEPAGFHQTPTERLAETISQASREKEDRLEASSDDVADVGNDFDADFDDVDDDDLEESLAALLATDAVEAEDVTDNGGSNVSDDDDWDPSLMDDQQVDPEILELLKSEIEDLRIQLAERDEQLAELAAMGESPAAEVAAPGAQGDAVDEEFGGGELVQRVDGLLAELAEHDDRVAMLQELLQTAEIQNQSEQEERHCLETWVGEIEQRMAERESEWQAEQDTLRSRLEEITEDRDRIQRQLHAAAKRYGKAAIGEESSDEPLTKLQQQNAELREALEKARKQISGLKRQLERVDAEEPESLQQERAALAKEKADVSRLRFQLSKQLQDVGAACGPKAQPDREFAHKLQTLREHLREIHEEEKIERERKEDSLLGRISSLWKRVDEEY